jgi:hypothetical protein
MVSEMMNWRGFGRKVLEVNEELSPHVPGRRLTKRVSFKAATECEVSSKSNLKNAVFWDVTPCSCKNRRFGGT